MQTLQEFIRSRRFSRQQVAGTAPLYHPRWEAAYPPKEDAPPVGGRARMPHKHYRFARMVRLRRKYAPVETTAMREAA